MKYIKGMIITCAFLGMASAGWGEEAVTTKGTAAKQGIRVAIRNAPGIDEVDLDNSFGGSGTIIADPQTGAQIDVMYAKRFMGKDGNNTVGPMVAGGLFVSNSSGEFFGQEEIELTVFGEIIEGGVAVQLGRVVVLEVTSFFGLGIANQSYSLPVTDGSGLYVLYGVKSAIYFQIGRNIELGLEAGYAGFSSDGKIEQIDGSTTDLTFTGGGFQGAGVFVVKF